MTTPEEEARLAAEGWIKHDGNGMPVEGATYVQVRYKEGGCRVGYASGLGGWDWRAPGYGRHQTTHYRVVTPAPVPADTLTIRDQFAMAAIPYFLDTLPSLPKGATPELVGTALAKHVYAFADAMLAERARK